MVWLHYNFVVAADSQERVWDIVYQRRLAPQLCGLTCQINQRELAIETKVRPASKHNKYIQ